MLCISTSEPMLAHAFAWSNSQMLVDTQKLVAPERFSDHFQAFFIIFDHVNACPSRRSLVEIHNIHIQVTRSCITDCFFQYLRSLGRLNIHQAKQCDIQAIKYDQTGQKIRC